MRRVARDHVLVEQGHRADGEADSYAQQGWPEAGVLEMKKLGRFLLVGFLSSCALAASPAVAASCYPTRAAMAAVERYNLKPMVLKGDAARQFVPVGGAGIRTVDFAALLFNADGEAAVFFGNVAEVCGPYRLTKEQVVLFLRPA